jgi:hypothetical protein
MTLQEMITRLQLLASVCETEGSAPEIVYMIDEEGCPLMGAKLQTNTLTDGSKVHNVILVRGA